MRKSKKSSRVILALIVVLLVIIIWGITSCTTSCSGPAAPTEPTAATEAIETTAVTEATKAPTEAPTEPAETEVPTEAPTEAPTEPNTAENNKPQGGTDQPGTTGSSSGQQTGSAGTGSSKPSGSTGSGSGTQQPPVTPPPATQPPVTVPPATQPPVTEPPATEHTHYYVVTSTIPATCTQDGSVTYTCDVCWDSYTEAVPAAHVWEHHHEDAKGHYVGSVICKCGAVFNSEPEWAAHAKSFGNVEALTNHGGWGSNPNATWVEDAPARDWDECSICGAIK